MKEVTRTVLVADEGMALTNGQTYCNVVYLAVDGDASAWREVPISEVPESEGEEE